MVAPSSAPLFGAVPYSGPSAYLGQVADRGSPTYIATYSVVIPDVLVGNEWLPGFFAFTQDGITVNRGTPNDTIHRFLGVFQNVLANEGDPGTNPWVTTFGNIFPVPVVRDGSVFVYNATPITTAIDGSVSILTSNDGTAPAEYKAGSLFQGTAPAGTTAITLSTRVTIMSSSSTAGSGVWIHLNA